MPAAATRDIPRWAAACAGVLGVGVALATGELLSALTRSVPSPIEAVGQQIIPITPDAVVQWAIATFGANDIAVLNGGATLVALLLGAAVGVVARRRPAAAVLAFGGFALLAIFAAVAGGQGAWLPTTAVLVVVALAGLAALRWALRRARPHDAVDVPAETATPSSAVGPRPASDRGAQDGGGAPEPGAGQVDRRRFLTGVASVGAVAVIAAAGGRFGLRRTFAVVDPDEVALPAAARALPPPPADASLDVGGISPLYTPNDRFYVIDTAVRTPQIAPEDWSLRIHGLVDREVVLTYDDVLAAPLEEIDATIACVSNEVGGDLVGNARWLGTRLDALLERAGVQEAAEQVLGRSTDGFSAGFPVEAAFDGRDAILAVGMNGAPLPTEHGFPARLIVPGLYGYVSATKWITEIELTTWDVEGYWIPRGWAREGPIKTQSRIDVPRRGASVDAGAVVVAGIAYAPTRGIAGVEVQLDGGGWQEAELAAELTESTWRQWRARVEVGPGDHVVQVRARDGEGELQPAGPTSPRPDGAEGSHRVTFRAV